MKRYRQKRDFSNTPEPSGASDKQKTRSKRPRFVIQKHDASQLHYDFRLQVGDSLKSWAVPKGPSTDPREKRLAQQVEDHPLDYAQFEGVIPSGQYGSGTVMVWDRGTYRHTTSDDNDNPISIEQALSNGHVTVHLRGRKLQGGFALTRTGGPKSQRWLLVKMKDDDADARRNPVSTQPKSVLSQRTLKQITREAASED